MMVRVLGSTSLGLIFVTRSLEGPCTGWTSQWGIPYHKRHGCCIKGMERLMWSVAGWQQVLSLVAVLAGSSEHVTFLSYLFLLFLFQLFLHCLYYSIQLSLSQPVEFCIFLPISLPYLTGGREWQGAIVWAAAWGLPASWAWKHDSL